MKNDLLIIFITIASIPISGIFMTWIKTCRKINKIMKEIKDLEEEKNE